MRPSILFGPEDDFFNRFAALARMAPALPLVGGGLTRFQPAFVGDVAAAIADAVDGKARAGTVYELGGPDIRTFKELMSDLNPPNQTRPGFLPSRARTAIILCGNEASIEREVR